VARDRSGRDAEDDGVTPDELLDRLAAQLWLLASSSARELAQQATGFPAEPNAPAPLQGRLLLGLDRLPDANLLAGLLRDLLGELPADGPLRLHGWRRSPDAAVGIALVAAQGEQRAVLALTPGEPPTLDVVVTAGTSMTIDRPAGDWTAGATISSELVWDVALSPGTPPPVPAGRATIRLTRTAPTTIGPPAGPGIAARAIAAELRAGSGAPLAFTLALEQFRAALLPNALAALLGAGADRATAPADLRLRADAAAGLRFEDGGLRVALPARLSLPALSARDFAVELGEHQLGLGLGATIALAARLPGVPVEANLAGVGLKLPLALGRGARGEQALGLLASEIEAPLPTSIGLDLSLPPVRGGGAVERTQHGYSGVLDLDLGILGVQALGLLELPDGNRQGSLLALLSARFPYPGIQLGFGFALDAVGGIVGINRRADVEQLRTLVSDGNADRILFPENAVARAREITRSLDSAFPYARGRCVIGPMVRVNWGGRMVTLAGAVVLGLPSPVQILLLGRLLVAVPDPAAPLIRLQASVFGRIDPTVPETELLVSLAGSWIVTTPVSGELYLLARGGRDPVFVLSAGGFHPRYQRPPGVPALDRLTLDLGGGYLGLTAEAYLAVTSNAMMFGAQLRLDATIAGCGVAGELGLDALFVWEPTFSFSVRVHASVAVRAFGRRLASIGLDFTLEGPAPWHAFGTGSISILWWDVSLDFDVRWGEAPRSLPQEREVLPLLRDALAQPSAWTVERPLEQRDAVRLTKAAKADLATGRAVRADATLRISQRVVPLGTTLQRFARTRVREQRWDLAGDGPIVTDRFVPGEFFDLPAEQQLTAPAFLEAKSGVVTSDKQVVLGAAHLVEDGYETGYKVEEGFQTAAPVRRHDALGRFALERYAHVAAADERLARWHAAQRPLAAATVAMR
jgi:hypothetical protein